MAAAAIELVEGAAATGVGALGVATRERGNARGEGNGTEVRHGGSHGDSRIIVRLPRAADVTHIKGGTPLGG